VYGDDQFANLSVPLRNAMPLDTHESAKLSGFLSSLNSLSNFSQLAVKFGFRSCIREHIDAQFYRSSHLCKVKIPRLENFVQFCQVRCRCRQMESSMLEFVVFISLSKTMHIASFLFSGSCFSGAQTAKIVTCSHCCLTRQPPFLHAHCNCRPSVFIAV